MITDKIQKHYTEIAKADKLLPTSTMRDKFTKELELQKITESIETARTHYDSINVLDAGCGNGYTIKKLAEKFDCDFVGFDKNPEMIKLAKSRKIEKAIFSVNDIFNPTKILPNSFEIVFTERCLINLETWERQMTAIKNIHKILCDGGCFIMLEAFKDGLKELNLARDTIGLEKIPEPWHNRYLKHNEVRKFLKPFFCDFSTGSSNIQFDSFLSTYYFGSRVLYPSLIQSKKNIVYNNKFVEYFSLATSVGNYGPIQVCVLQKVRN